MNLIPQKTGHKLDKQDNEKMWDFEELYGETPHKRFKGQGQIK